MFKEFRADLHIHTCLSPCADIQMTPSAIVKIAAERSIDIIAVTDHNSAENVNSVIKAAENSDLTVLAGMEVTSSEEAHILALFDNTDSAVKLQDTVYERLLPGENDEKRFGEQIVVNEKNEVLSFNKRILIAATSLTAESIVSITHSLGGISIASHIDRETFGLISQLGFIPDTLKLDALEISPQTDRKKAEDSYNDYRSFAWVSSSDAHYLDDIGKRTTRLYMRDPSFSEIILAIRNYGGRKAEWN